jgi:hypothetical protein
MNGAGAHMYFMKTHPKKAMIPINPPERNREAVLARAAELKRSRDRDATQVMKEYETKRLATLAKTAQLRASRLARIAAASSAENHTEQKRK